MKLAYFDVFAGASGDMILGALLDAARPEVGREEWVRGQLEALGLPGWRLAVEREARGHILGTRAVVEAAGHPPERTFYDIRFMLEAAKLDERVRRLSLEAFGRLAEAEGSVHGVDRDLVHFHEVGAVDSIIDIVGAAACFVALGLEAAYCSALPVGSGLVECRHGTLPVPAPATLELLKGAPLVPGAAAGELTTPTAAALLATFCGPRFGPMPPLRLEAVGYGVGSRDFGSLPNLLRIVVGDSEAAQSWGDEVVVLETNIDDMNPQLYGNLMSGLFGAGALDVWLSPIQMKKDRPAMLVAALCPVGGEEACVRVLFRESTTLGVRISRRSRLVCAREVVEVETPLGKVALKLARDPWGGVRAVPEMESVREAASRAQVTLPEAYRVACEAASRLLQARAAKGESG
jgi:uncharacterized protein (TIGR00299 family) protein